MRQPLELRSSGTTSVRLFDHKQIADAWAPAFYATCHTSSASSIHLMSAQQRGYDQALLDEAPVATRAQRQVCTARFFLSALTNRTSRLPGRIQCRSTRRPSSPPPLHPTTLTTPANRHRRRERLAGKASSYNFYISQEASPIILADSQWDYYHLRHRYSRCRRCDWWCHWRDYRAAQLYKRNCFSLLW